MRGRTLFDPPPQKQMKKGRFPKEARVVFRSNNNANANGGVAYANANNDSANVNANIGSRLANNYVLSLRNFGVQQWERVSRSGANGNAPQQQREQSRKAGTYNVGWSLVGIIISRTSQAQKIEGNKK